MKTEMLLVLLICAMVQMEAQSSQVKLYLQQIAANKVLIEYIQKGYKIAKTGLTTIGSIRNGEFNLHRDFFSSLKAINPNIKNSAIVVDIIALQVKIIKLYKSNYKRIKESGQFTFTEIKYIYSVFTRLLDGTTSTLRELLTLETADQYQMSDDERIKRMDGLYTDMQRNYLFAQHFGNDGLSLASLRMKEKLDVETSRNLYGIVPRR